MTSVVPAPGCGSEGYTVFHGLFSGGQSGRGYGAGTQFDL